MNASETSLRALGAATLSVLVACRGGPPKPAERAAQTPLILEQVLRYEVHQFAGPRTGVASAAVCIGVHDGKSTADPSPAIMRGLADHNGLRPISECATDASVGLLVAGPIEWLRDDEVRVKGHYRGATQNTTPLAYRVTWEHDRWACLGPIISWDPL